MKNRAIGWACNLNEIFIRFPYEKCQSLMTKWRTFQERRKIVKQVFREGLRLVLEDIIDNNVTFKIQGIGYQGGEIHMEAITGSEFERVKKLGKFKDVDFLESFFTGYQMYLYVHGKRDNFLHRRKFPIYLNKYFKDKITENTNKGKQYC